jgi:hypothetical protein
MNEPHYVLYADQPLYKRLPWWVWALGIGALVVLIVGRGKGRDAGYEDYLR